MQLTELLLKYKLPYDIIVIYERMYITPAYSYVTSFVSIVIGYVMHIAVLGITMVLCNVLLIQNAIEFTVP